MKDPRNLPELESLKDILLEIKDTDDYLSGRVEISLYRVNHWDVQGLAKDIGEYINNVDRVVVYEAVLPTISSINIYDEDFAQPTTVSIKKIEYRVDKLLVNLSIKIKNVSVETREIVFDVFERVKNYLNGEIFYTSSLYDEFTLIGNVYESTILGSSVG